MALRLLQANINHCARAQDLLCQSMAQWLIHIAVVAEPYSVPPRDNWVGDTNGVVALVSHVATGTPPFERVSRGQGYVAAVVGDITIIGVYFSPNRTLAEFEQFLVEVGAVIGRSHPHPVLVAGDLNAKSVAWGSPATDARGDELLEWAISSGLEIQNRGTVNTCVRQQGGSIVDVTFADAALARRVQSWVVLAGVETLSDHRYIRFDVSASSMTLARPSRSPSSLGPRWVMNKMDRELLKEAAMVQAWQADSMGPIAEVETGAGWFRDAMSRICDAAMPRAKRLPPRRRVYWWSAELSHLREVCATERRRYTHQRRRRVRNESAETSLYEAYIAAKKELSVAISQAIELSREMLLETLNHDPWGRPYKMVRSKLRPWAPPVTESLQPQLLDQIVSTLFPDRGVHRPPVMALSVAEEDEGEVPSVSEGELGAAVLRLKAKNTAPGPDGIPGRALVLAMDALEPRLRELFSACVEQARFPREWKTGRLVLLRKEGRPTDSPSAYRPIVLLDEVGKLFERVVVGRLVRHMKEVGPDLADNQFGFRSGRSTVDAILRVKHLAEEAAAQGETVLAVSLDIANAFNTLPWATIKEALLYHGVPRYLRRVVEAYLSERFVNFPGRHEWGQRQMMCGVPQGSVLGPLLWNIGYDWVLRGTNLPGVDIVCYADDTLVTARGGNYRESAILVTAAVAHVVGRIRRIGLEVALNKSEAISFHGPRRAPPAGSHIVVGGQSIGVGSTMRYLGVVLDSRWTFRAHFERLAPKLLGAAAALGRILPNTGGPKASCRRLYLGVVRSMALYGAPVWAYALTSRTSALLRRSQRVMAVRAIRAYRTVSTEVACVLAGSLPWDLEARTLAGVYFWREEARSRDHWPAAKEVEAKREELRLQAVERWKERLETPSAGLRTIEAVRPVLSQWLERSHGALTFRLTQVLTGHGCFGRYLCRIAGREPTMECHTCGEAEDTAQHTLELCPAWARQRDELAQVVGADLSLPAVIKSMVDSDRSWNAMLSFCEEVLAQKEREERAREDAAEAPQQRRRRVGRRRLAYDRRLPP
jgi:hypothetical protein